MICFGGRGRKIEPIYKYCAAYFDREGTCKVTPSLNARYPIKQQPAILHWTSVPYRLLLSIVVLRLPTD